MFLIFLATQRKKSWSLSWSCRRKHTHLNVSHFSLIYSLSLFCHSLHIGPNSKMKLKWIKNKTNKKPGFGQCTEYWPAKNWWVVSYLICFLNLNEAYFVLAPRRAQNVTERKSPTIFIIAHCLKVFFYGIPGIHGSYIAWPSLLNYK